MVDGGMLVKEKTFSSAVKKKLEEYCDEVIKSNTSINLISKNTEDNIWNRHIIDSAQVVDIIPSEFKSFLDIGSGAGFPGIVVKLINSNLDATLIESNKKKARFLKDTTEKIGIDVNIFNKRFEDIEIANNQETVILSRAVSSLGDLLRMGFKYFELGSIGIFHKGITWENEVAEAKKRWNFHLTPYESLTNKGSRILLVRDIIKK